MEADVREPRPTFYSCGVRIDAVGPDAASRAIVEASRAGRGRSVHLCNAYTLSLAHRDPSFADAVNRGDLNLMDGMPLVWLARRLGFREVDRAYGPDLMLDVMAGGREVGLRHYLYGSTPEVTAALRQRLEQRIPGVKIAATESPAFRDLTLDEERDFEEAVRRTDADIVWVGLGTPKQDHFVERFSDRVPATLVAVGAAFDFHAGAKQQAPRWMQRAGLEWLFRLLKEPRRLWRRYLVGNAVFLAAALRTTHRADRPDGDPERGSRR